MKGHSAVDPASKLQNEGHILEMHLPDGSVVVYNVMLYVIAPGALHTHMQHSDPACTCVTAT